ncbi:probable cytochrome P450 6a23 [Microplitis mediator]|uniref:probable cytochrome P450 6a23 n=1 Tax=Microplitis mediator TaxID=375433 RepID=UPI002557BB07|nr:probable cytochrome P450 6a23 [Microplitis mediator]
MNIINLFSNLCLITTSISILMTLFYLYLTSTFNYWSVRDVLYKKPTVIFGNFSDLLLFKKSQPEVIKDMYNWFNSSYFGVFRVRSPILFIRDPELIKRVCAKDFKYFINRGIPTNTEDALSCHLFNLEGNKWKNLRHKLTPVFSGGKIKKMFPLLQECGVILYKLINKTGGDAAVDVRELAVNFTIDVIGSCAFGIKINALTDEQSEFHCAVKKLSKPSYKSTLWRMLRTAIPRAYKLFKIQIIDRDVIEFFKDIVKQMIAQRELEHERQQRRNDFMDLLIELKNNCLHDNNYNNEDNIELNENTIAAQAFVFFVAGYETSSNTIAFCLHELALNFKIQKRLKDEIETTIKKHGELTYESVQEMTYLEKVILETLRKYPPAAMISRRCESTYEIPNTKVKLPPGMRVIIPIYGLHHDPNYYPEPDKFDPERFSNKSIINSYTFMPFGEGPRNCIGIRFAMLLVKIGLISFLKNNTVQVSNKTTDPIIFSRRSLVTSSENGFWLNIYSDN